MEYASLMRPTRGFDDRRVPGVAVNFTNGASRDALEGSGMLSPSACFDLHRFLIQGLVRKASTRPDVPDTGGAILMRVVYPTTERQASSHEGPEQHARPDPRIAVQIVDIAATLSAPHALAESLWRWAPIPEGLSFETTVEPSSQQNIRSQSVIHLAFAPQEPGASIFAVSISADGQIASNVHTQSGWAACDFKEGFIHAMKRVHIQAAGLPTPTERQPLQDLHAQLRIRALARRAAAITMNEVRADQPHISTVLMGKRSLNKGATCTTPQSIRDTFACVVVNAALRHTQRHHARVRRSGRAWD